MLRYLLLLFVAPLFASGTTPLTIDDYVTVEHLSQPVISPDGRRVAYVVSVPSLEDNLIDANVWIAHLDGEPRTRQLTTAKKSDDHPQWSPEGSVLTFLSDRESTTGLYSIDPDGGEARRMTDVKGSIRDYEWAPDGKTIAFTMRDERGAEEARRRARGDDARIVGQSKQVHLHLLDVRSGAVRRLTSGDFSVHSYGWAPDSKAIVIATAPGTLLAHQYQTDLDVLDVATGARRPLVRSKGPDMKPRVSPDGKLVVFATGNGRIDWAGDAHFSVVPFKGGEPKIISAEYNRSGDEPVWSPDSRKIVFRGPWDTTGQLFSIDVSSGKLTHLTRFEGVIDQATFDLARDRAVFVQESLDEAPELHVSSLSRFQPRKLTSRNERFATKIRGETKLIRWKNPADGLEIEGLLTLPVGHRRGEKVPLLTFVHGGPSSYFDQKFFGYLWYIYPTHVFAARGYAVLRPNPRGSGARGEQFRQANRGDWGGGDWADITAGIDKLVADGIADPARLGLMGWSYGGYMTAWGITQTDRFRAASIGAPVIDLFTMDGPSDIPGFTASFLGGTAHEKPEFYRSRNPLSHVSNVKTPALIQHGEDDQRVPYFQSLLFHQALEDHGVPVVMVAYPRSGHTPREPLLRRDVARRNVWWFAKWIEEDNRSFEEFWKE